MHSGRLLCQRITCFPSILSIMLSALFSLKLLKTKENMIYFTNFYFLLELAHDIE